jgi:hypothetical protein
MGNVVPSHLMDRNLYPFTTIQATGVADAGGDKAFDDDDPCARPSTATVQWPTPQPARQEMHEEDVLLFLAGRCRCWGGCAAHEQRQQRGVSSFGDWPAGRASPAPMPSSACRRSRRRPRGRALEAAARRRRCRRPASSPRRRGRSPTCWCSWAQRFTRRCARPGTTRCGGAAASAATATAPWIGPRWGMQLQMDFPRYEREVALLIRDRASGKPLFERAPANEGSSRADTVRTVVAMFEAALADFPRLALNPRRHGRVSGAADQGAAAASARRSSSQPLSRRALPGAGPGWSWRCGCCAAKPQL